MSSVCAGEGTGVEKVARKGLGCGRSSRSGSAPSHPGAPPPSWAGLVLAVLPTLPSARDQACPSLNTPELTLAITPVALRLGQQGCPGHLSPLLGETLCVFRQGLGSW